MKEIYPLTVVNDRYGGTYSGGKFTAWSFDSDLVPSAIHADDMTCHDFWLDFWRPVGKGDTIEEAIADLARQLEDG